MNWEAIGAITNPIMNGINLYFQQKNRKENIEREDKIIQENRQREDNAHQREVADLQASGLSPLANMTGSGATAQTATSQEAPQMDINAMNDAIATISQREIAEKQLEQQKTEHQENITHQRNILEETKREFDVNTELTKQLKEIDTEKELAVMNAEQKALIDKANATYENASRDRKKALSEQSETNYQTFCDTVGTTVQKYYIKDLDEYYGELNKFETRYGMFLDFLATDKKYKKTNLDSNISESKEMGGGGGAGVTILGTGGSGSSNFKTGNSKTRQPTFEQSKLIQQAWKDFSEKKGIKGEFKYPVYIYFEPNNREIKQERAKVNYNW